MLNLKNKTALITGATSGIGKACAYKFAEAGANLILVARRQDRLDEISKDIMESHDVDVHTVQLDIRNYEEVKEKLAGFPDKFSKIDILLNNAGLARGLSKINDGDVDAWNEMIDTNVKGLLYVTRTISPLMVEQKNGHIINIGSVAGHDAYPNGNVYCATKFAVKALTQSMRLDLLDQNIKVTTVDPGAVVTEFSLVRFSGDEEKAKNVYNGFSPLTPEDVAETVLFAATRPPHVNLTEIIINPSSQANSLFIHKEQ